MTVMLDPREATDIAAALLNLALMDQGAGSAGARPAGGAGAPSSPVSMSAGVPRPSWGAALPGWSRP